MVWVICVFFGSVLKIMPVLEIIAMAVGAVNGAAAIIKFIKRLQEQRRITREDAEAAVSLVKTIVATKGTPKATTPVRMDEVEHVMTMHRCSFCRQPGHNIRTCKAAKRGGGR